MDWQARRDQAIGFVLIGFGATVGVALCIALVIGVAVGFAWIARSV